MLTLKTYAHAMREEEVDLGFATFGDGSKRLYPAPKNGVREKLSTPAKLVELRGIEPLTLRLPACARRSTGVRGCRNSADLRHYVSTVNRGYSWGITVPITVHRRAGRVPPQLRAIRRTRAAVSTAPSVKSVAALGSGTGAETSRSM